MQKRIGKALVSVDITTEDYGAEVPGECEWTFSMADLRKVFARFPKLRENGNLGDGIGQAIEYSSESDCLKEGLEYADSLDDFTDEAMVSFQDADAGILILHAIGCVGGEGWSVYWTGENATWFFHDWDHAECDAYDDGDTVAIEIDADTGMASASERRTRRSQIGNRTLGSVLGYRFHHRTIPRALRFPRRRHVWRNPGRVQSDRVLEATPVGMLLAAILFAAVILAVLYYLLDD